MKRTTGVLIGAMLFLPNMLQAFVVYGYDARTDWVKYDFVGWVRVERLIEQPKLVKGNAALRLKVIEKLAGEDMAQTLALEHLAALPGKDGEVLTLSSQFYWNTDAPPGSEYLVFLTKLENGAYWCDGGRNLEIAKGKFNRLPIQYEAVLKTGPSPTVHDFIAKVRATTPGIRARIGRPLFDPPLTKNSRKIESPKDGFDRIIRALRKNRSQEADRLIFPADKTSSPNYFRGLSAERRAEFAQAEVLWQAVIDDYATVVAAFGARESNDRHHGIFYMIWQGDHWLLLNPTPSPVESLELAKLFNEDLVVTFDVLREQKYQGELLHGKRIKANQE